MKIEVIGIDHIYISVSQPARSEKYYDRILPLLGFKKNTFLNESDLHIQYYNRHFGYVLRPAQAGAAPGPLRPDRTTSVSGWRIAPLLIELPSNSAS
jgi:glyoxylase I family protein